jgi:hypothetical protein
LKGDKLRLFIDRRLIDRKLKETVRNSTQTRRVVSTAGNAVAAV